MNDFDTALQTLFKAWADNVHTSDARLVKAITEPMAQLGRAAVARPKAYRHPNTYCSPACADGGIGCECGD